MTLGFSAISAGGVGDGPLIFTHTQTAGSISVPVLGFLMNAGFGTPTFSVVGKVTLTGLQATAQLGRPSSISANNSTLVPITTLFATGSIGTVTAGAQAANAVIGFRMDAVLGPLGYVGKSTVTPTGVQGAGQLGDVNQLSPSEWIEVVPASVPGWTTIITTAR